jgi:hypothetical protein
MIVDRPPRLIPAADGHGMAYWAEDVTVLTTTTVSATHRTPLDTLEDTGVRKAAK